MDDQEEVQPTLPETLRRLGSAILAIVQNRLELLIVELHENRLRFFEALLLVVAIVALGLFTLSLAAAAAIVLMWNHFGVIGLFILSAVGLVATLLVFWRLYLRLKDWPLLQESLEQLKKDRECLENK
jgi:uncharacterized membrane protein YqjE